MNETTLISVCIPVYNCVDYILDSVESALCQTYPNLEVLVYENVSTDGTLDAVRCLHSDKLRIIEAVEHVGMAENWNRAIQQARGEWVLVLSADDMLTPNAITLLSEQLIACPNAGFTYGAVQYFSAGKARVMSRALEVKHVGIIDDLETFVIERAFSININSVLIRKNLMHFSENVGVVCDLDLMIRLGKEGVKATIIEQDVLFYRVHDAALSSNRERMWQETLDVYLHHEKKSLKHTLYQKRIFRTLVCLIVCLVDGKQRKKAKISMRAYALTLTSIQKLFLNILIILPCSTWFMHKMRSARRGGV